MGAKILVLEDEVIVGLDLAMQLEEEGYSCIGPARTVEEALALIEESPPDFGILDANLDGTTSIDVANRLRALNLPFVYVSGYGSQGVLEHFPEAPLISKPLRFDRLSAHIRERLGEGS